MRTAYNHRRTRVHSNLMEQVSRALSGEGGQDFSVLKEELEAYRSDNDISSADYQHILFLLEGYI